jgi:CheY-like chemotaxis protein
MRRVLVVEDYDDARDLVATLLEHAGYSVVAAADGFEGVAMARKHLPDAILMDIFMPRLDGIEATRQLKTDELTERIPVIAYTARSAPLGTHAHLFDAVCVKPCPPDLLLSTLERVMVDAS